MNSKSKIWQIVLLVLLVIAIAAILLFNNKLNASKETLSSTIAQLTEEQQNSAALQADLDAAKADYDDVSEQLTQEKAKTDQLNQAVEEGKAAAEQLQSDLAAATDQVTQLEGAAAESEAKIEQLEGAVAESEAKIAGLVDAAAESEKKIAGLESTVAASEEKIAQLESDVAQREETIDSLNAAVTQAENKALEHQITFAQMKLDGTLAAITGLRQKGVALPEAVSDLDVEALKDEIAAVVGAEPEAMEPAERLAALEEIQEKLAGAEPEIQALVEQAGIEVEPEGPATEQAEPEPEQAEPEKTEAEAEQAEALKETMAGIEAAIVKVAGLQAAGEAVDVDLDGIRQQMTDVIEDTSEAMTDEARVEALMAIREKLEDALPVEAADEKGEAPEETAEGDPGEDIMAAMQAQLSAAEAEVETLSTQLADQLQDIDDLHAAIAKLDAKAESDAESLSDLQDKLDAAEAEAQARSEALAEAQKVYEKRLAEMQAYKLDHAPASGEAHLSTAVNNAIQVAADGVTASWQYANSDLSGNAATIALVLDGETIYTSGSLKPGETLQDITLNRALEPGEYQAVAVTTVYDADGEPQLTSRVPVTLSVAAD